jgi:putative addiction module component (TIGR02574 family)
VAGVSGPLPPLAGRVHLASIAKNRYWKSMPSEFAPLFKLGRAERLQLVEDLWDSIAQEDAPLPVAEWKREELRRRKDRFMQNTASGLTWEKVKELARSRND